MPNWNLTSSSISVEPYTSDMKDVWDGFIAASKNGTFLFHRDYMDYHHDRFEDNSLMLRNSRRELVAVMPASRSQGMLISHGGLTYGGFITAEKMTVPLMMEIMRETLSYMHDAQLSRLIYKAVPHIYHRRPAEEDLYALVRYGAVLCRRDVTTVLSPAKGWRLQTRRERCLKKARELKVTCRASEDYDVYWQMLAANLASRYGLGPIHTVDEIIALHQSFPNNIRLFCAYLNEEMVAGVVIYESEQVAHAQYTAANEPGLAAHALDALFDYLLREIYVTKPYFDFGISTEAEGQRLNVGLIEFKEGFDGRAIVHDFYAIDVVA